MINLLISRPMIYHPLNHIKYIGCKLTNVVCLAIYVTYRLPKMMDLNGLPISNDDQAR